MTSLSFSSTPDLLRAALAPLLASRPVVIVGITGPVGAGKTTLARALSPCILSTDHYLPDYDRVPYEQRDHPDHADLARLAADLALLRSNQPAEIPRWSFHSHRREGYDTLTPAPLIICEGIHALHALARPHLDLKIFVDAPRDTRWSRWEAIERAGLRGLGVEKARHFFDHVAEPAFSARAADYRAAADYIITNDQEPENKTEPRL